ncbi:MAG: zinc ribbon domain-containing protein [Lachnospiraceae bacterium]|nr:zinc ribbon domain-containing protein [Lachnospiraceae bacterium]
MYCTNCGNQVEDDMFFCPECGEKLVPVGHEEFVGVEENGNTETDISTTETGLNIAEEEVALSVAALPEQSWTKGKLTPKMVLKVFDRRADRWFQTSKGRIVWRGIIGVTGLSVAVMAGRAGLFFKNYGWLYQYDLSTSAVSALQQEVNTGEEHVEKAEGEFEQVRTRYEYLASYDVSKEWEDVVKRQITELSVENQMIVQQMKAVVMNEMGYKYTPSYSQRQYEDLGLNLQNDVIDALSGGFSGGEIIGSGVKAALDAASEEASLDDILEGAKEGILEGSVGYVQDEILGDIGGRVVGILDVVNSTKTKIESMGSAPPAALDLISNAQETYLKEMQNFVNAEQIASEDMTGAYHAMCGYQNMNQTLKALAKEGEQVINPRKSEAEQLIEQYNKNLILLQKYIGMAEGGAK